MNSEHVWGITIGPTPRRRPNVQIHDAITADQIFNMLMVDEVAPRKAYIE